MDRNINSSLRDCNHRSWVVHGVNRGARVVSPVPLLPVLDAPRDLYAGISVGRQPPPQRYGTTLRLYLPTPLTWPSATISLWERA